MKHGSHILTYCTYMRTYVTHIYGIWNPILHEYPYLYWWFATSRLLYTDMC